MSTCINMLKQEAVQDSSGSTTSGSAVRTQPPTPSPQQQQPGLLRRWLPGWGGWYSQQSEEGQTGLQPTGAQTVKSEDHSVQAEQQIGEYPR